MLTEADDDTECGTSTDEGKDVPAGTPRRLGRREIHDRLRDFNAALLEGIGDPGGHEHNALARMGVWVGENVQTGMGTDEGISARDVGQSK